MSLFRAAEAFCSAWHMRLASRRMRLGPWYAGKRPRRCLFGILGVGLVPRGLGNWIRHQSVPETLDRDSEQRWPRRNPHARECRSESRTARVSVATVAVVAVASGRAAVAAEANMRGKRHGYLKR